MTAENKLSAGAQLYSPHKQTLVKRAMHAACAVTVIVGTFASATPAWAEGPVVVVTNGLASWVEGPDRVTPAKGQQGTTLGYPFRPYILPGEVIKESTGPTDPGGIIGAPFSIAYAPGVTATQPVQSTDWWAGVGLQWQGWVLGTEPANPVIRSQAFINEPFHMQFLDLPEVKRVQGLDAPTQGLRFWNQNTIDVFTASANTASNLFGRADLGPQESPIVTVGLSGTHPIASSVPVVPTTAPYTNIRIKRYTDWGVEMAYGHDGSELSFTMASGSPFVWAERTQGNAPFRVWAGTFQGDANGQLSVWHNAGGVIGITVTNSMARPAQAGLVPTTAAYIVYADAGDWTEQQATQPDARMSLFTNAMAAKVVIAAVPHNVPLTDTAALEAALTDLEPYAWKRISDTQLNYPPIPGSDTSVTLGGVTKPLGYDRATSTLRTLMQVTAEDFRTGQPVTDTMQIVFPHHRKLMTADDKARILTANGAPKYTWRSVKGELQAFVGNSYVQEIRARGVLPFLPSAAVSNNAQQVAGQQPAEDLYATLKAWFYVDEPNSPITLAPFIRNLGTYVGYQQNTYVQFLPTLWENMTIADQLSKSSWLADTDPDLNKSKRAVAADMRDTILDSLKELVGRWADVYTSGFFQYNSAYDTFLGYPEGYGSVQNLNDKHFHWGYFLRSAAAIGRYDPEWLNQYLPFFNELRADVSNYDRASTRYPFLRNFNPFYSHSWANGTGNGGNGPDQESTSEAVNFAAGLIDLGQVLNNKDWVDVGTYLYESEILGVEQYWFNQDGDPTTSSGTFYNGNWPDAFVRFQLNGQTYYSYIIGQIFQNYATRGTFFEATVTAGMTIQAIPLSASHLYLGRNQKWLAAMWAEYVREAALDPAATTGVYEALVAGVQAQLPGSGSGITDPGTAGSLTRVNTQHKPFPGALSTMGKYWAYTLGELGQVDTSVVADAPGYGVFCKGGTGANCAGGVRTFVAYNGSSASITVTFKDATTGATITTLAVPSQALASKVGNANEGVDAPTRFFNTQGRLYLRKPTTFSPTCDALSANAPLSLTTQAGSFRLPAGQTPFPSDTSALADSIVCVPARTDGGSPIQLPPDGYVRSWTGTFSGNLDPMTSTRFAVFTNQSLFPGWQLDPCVTGNVTFVPSQCPNFGINPSSSNVMSMMISYDFDSDGTPDRIEQYQNMSLSAGNAWSYESKQTDYKFGASWPYLPPPVNIVGPPGVPPQDFPQNIPASRPATVKVTIFGGSGVPNANGKDMYPIPVSVNADPLTNRASWVRPPYSEPAFCASATGVCHPPPQRKLYFPWVALQGGSLVTTFTRR